MTDDLVACTFATNIFICWDGGELGDPNRLAESLRLTGSVILIGDHARNADVATELSEVFNRRADIVGHVKRLQVIRCDNNHFLTHVSGDRQTKATTNDIT